MLIFSLWDDKATGYLCPEALSKNLILQEQKECRFSLNWLISAFFFYLKNIVETKPFEEFYRHLLPCSAGMCTDKNLWNNENEMCKLLTVFLAQQSRVKKPFFVT